MTLARMLRGVLAALLHNGNTSWRPGTGSGLSDWYPQQSQECPLAVAQLPAQEPGGRALATGRLLALGARQVFSRLDGGGSGWTHASRSG